MFVNQPYFPYIGMIAQNTNTTVNDVDLLAVYVKNMDETKYSNKGILEDERLRYLLKKHEGGLNLVEGSEEGTSAGVHAHDLLAIKI